jgi:hypothetical protein
MIFLNTPTVPGLKRTLSRAHTRHGGLVMVQEDLRDKLKKINEDALES